MGKPYWGYENYLMGSTVTARTENSVYPATNLSRYTMHRHRSASKAVVLDGTADYLWIADDTWNSYTGDFCFEFLFRPNTVDTSSADKFIINKWGSPGQKGYCVTQYDDDIRVYLSSDGTATSALVTFAAVLTAAQDDRLKLSYAASTATLVLRINGVISGQVTGSTPSGTAGVTGAVPTSIFNGTTRLTIGADHVGACNLAGRLGFVGLVNATSGNGGYLYPTSCNAYYSFDSSNGNDSSGNNRHLTPVSLASGDYSNCTAYHFIMFTLPATQNPTFLFLDRRHNLTSTGTVRLLRGDRGGVYDSVTSVSVTVGQPVVSRFSSTTTNKWWLEINDPDNSDGYIEIPYVYLGSYTSMERAHLRGYSHEEPQPGNPDSDSFGNLTGHVIGGQVWVADLKFRCNATDFSTMQSVWDECARYRPVVFCEDVDYESTKTRLVKVYPINYQHIYTTNQWVESKLREVAIGL